MIRYYFLFIGAFSAFTILLCSYFISPQKALDDGIVTCLIGMLLIMMMIYYNIYTERRKHDKNKDEARWKSNNPV